MKLTPNGYEFSYWYWTVGFEAVMEIEDTIVRYRHYCIHMGPLRWYWKLQTRGRLTNG